MTILGLPNNDKVFTHTQVGKIGLVIFDIEAFKISKAIYIIICIVWTA
jgi:hypothetical protein